MPEFEPLGGVSLIGCHGRLEVGSVRCFRNRTCGRTFGTIGSALAVGTALLLASGLAGGRRGGVGDLTHLRHHGEQGVLIDLGAVGPPQPPGGGFCSHMLIGGLDSVRYETST
ncbi:hypothetical protein ACWY4P_04420 [Streptomyces sp. LZ34]